MERAADKAPPAGFEEGVSEKDKDFERGIAKS